MGRTAREAPARHAWADAGRIVNANLADYLVPVNAGIPDLRAIYLDGNDPRPTLSA